MKKLKIILMAIMLVQSGYLFSEEKIKNNNIENINNVENIKIDNNISANNIGLVLSGGSAKGIAHIGVLKVLEEEKVPIEYVTGTSMGSIIGGLYSIGYTPTEIEEIAKNMDWLSLFNDTIPRENKKITRTLIEDKNSLVLPMEKLVPKIPSGAIGGKTASERLNELFYGVIDQNDFRKFTRKFALVAVDLNTGEGVMIDKGSISTAIRSSMSIPSLFNPMKVNDKLYVDGGVIRNLPVQDVKVLGADYTIGVNVGEGFKQREVEKLNIVGVISDSITIAGRQEVERQKRMLDLYLEPNLENLESFDFNKVKELISAGEKVARDNIEKIRELSNPEKFYELEEKRKEFRKTWKNNYYITKIQIKGNKKYKNEYFEKYFPNTLGSMNKSQMEKIVNDLYSNGDFSTVYYEIENENILVINVQEKVGDYLTSNTYIDTEDKAVVSVGIQGNKSINKLDARYELKGIIGNEYGLDGVGVLSLGKENKGLLVGKFNLKKDIIKNQVHNNEKFDFNNRKIKVSLGIGSEIYKNTMFLANVGYQESTITKHLNNNENNKIQFPYYEINLVHDNRDSATFPKKGQFFKVDYILSNSNEAKFKTIYTEGEVNIPINNKLTFSPSISYINTSGENIPISYQPRLGGFKNNDYSLEFGAISPDSINSNEILSGKLKLQYEVFKFTYLSASFDIAKIIDENNKEKNVKKAFTTGIGFKTPIGPGYFGISKSPGEREKYFLKFGYDVKAFNEK